MHDMMFRRSAWGWGLAACCAGLMACSDEGVRGTDPEPKPQPLVCEPDCIAGASCVVSGSQAFCQCSAGYAYDSVAGCQNINECIEGSAQCAEPYVCADNDGGYDCVCPAGLDDVNGHCEDPVSGLAKVRNLQATLDGNTVELQWDLVDGATSYQIFESTSEGGTRGGLGSDRALIGTVATGRVFTWELPTGALDWAEISATPFIGESVISLRNDGVGLRIDHEPRRLAGSERYFSVVPVADADDVNMALMADSVSARTEEQLLRCAWQYRSLFSGDPTWKAGVTTKSGGLEVHETSIQGALEYRCVPQEDGAVVRELVESPTLYAELQVAEGYVGTCNDGERATAEFESFTDCGGQCAAVCQVPAYVGDVGPITVLYGDDVTDVDVSWSGIPPVLSVSVDGETSHLFEFEDHGAGRATLSVTGLAAALGTHELTIRATSEMTGGPVAIPEQKLTVVVRPRHVEKLAIGSFGCAVIEGGYLKCFGQNPRGILGNGGSKSPGVMIPAHQVRPLKMALREGAKPEYVIDLDVNRDVACALIGEEGGASRRVSCWGGKGSPMPSGIFDDDNETPPEIHATDLLHVSSIPGDNDVFGDASDEIPGALTANSAIKDALSDAEKIIVGRPWLCVQNGAGTLNCADGTRRTTISGVVDVWTEPGGVFSCVTTQTEAWCGPGMPDPAMRIEGKIVLPRNTVMPPQRVAMLMQLRAVAVQDASGQVFVGSMLDANGESYADGHIEFPLLPQLAPKPLVDLQNFQRMLVSSNAVCDSRNDKAHCWGLGLKRFADADVVPSGLKSLGEHFPVGYERLIEDVEAIEFVEAATLEGKRWYLDNKKLCTWSEPSDEVHCRQDSAALAAHGVIAMEYGFKMAEACDDGDFSCAIGALLASTMTPIVLGAFDVWGGLNSLRPGWISPDQYSFTHHLIEGPPESFGPELSNYYVQGRPFYLPRWFADGDGDAVTIKSLLKVGTAPATKYAFHDTCNVSEPVFIDGEMMAGCLDMNEPLLGRSSIIFEVDDGIQQVTETTGTLIGLQLPLVRDLAVGAAHVCVLGDPHAGYMSCWGSNSRGQLGDPSLVGRNFTAQAFVLTREPVDVKVGHGNRPLVGIAAGRAHTCAVLEAMGTNGPEIICSGDNTYGAVTPAPHVFPGCEPWQPCDCVGPDCFINGFYAENTIRLGDDVAQIKDFQLGADYSCALVQTYGGDDRLTCWGDLRFFNELLPVGVGANVSPIPDPSCTQNVVVSGATPGLVHFGPSHFKDPDFPAGAVDREFQSVGLGLNHICVGAMQRIDGKRTGRVYCAGDNRDGQLGRTTNVQRASCFEAAPAITFQPAGTEVRVRAGRDYSCATYSVYAGKPEVYCWGANDRGQRGRGPASDETPSSPIAAAVRKPDGTKVIPGTWDQSDFEAEAQDYATRDVGALTVGLDHACTSTAEGAFYCWGDNRGYLIGIYATYGRDEGLSELNSMNERLPVLGRLGAAWPEPFSSYARFAGHALGPVFKADTYGTTTCVIVGSSEVKCFGPSAAGETGRAGTWGDDELGLNGPGGAF